MIDLSKPLLIRVEAVQEMASLENVAKNAIEKTKTWLDEDENDPPYRNLEVKNGVAVLGIHGILMERPDWWDVCVYDAQSTNDLTRQVIKLAEDETVKKVYLDLDSPGGEVGGIQNLARAINNLAARKETIAYVHSMACSGAYWIASACKEVILSDQVATVGSIGVVIAHREISELEKKIGIKTTEITAGKYKRAVSAYEPLSDDGRRILLERANDVYQVFLADVAGYRGVSVDDVLKMAEGLEFIGDKAIEVGIADKIEFIPDFFKGGNDLDEKELIEKYPDLFKTVTEKGRAQGREEENVRVCGILSIKMKGYEAAKLRAIRDRRSVQDLSVAIVQGKEEEDPKKDEDEEEEEEEKKKKPEEDEEEAEEEKKKKPEEDEEEAEGDDKSKKKAMASLYKESRGVKSRFESKESDKVDTSTRAAVEAANKR